MIKSAADDTLALPASLEAEYRAALTDLAARRGCTAEEVVIRLSKELGVNRPSASDIRAYLVAEAQAELPPHSHELRESGPEGPALLDIALKAVRGLSNKK